MTCACCIHCRHTDGYCLKNDFHDNLDRGFCRDFDFVSTARWQVAAAWAVKEFGLARMPSRTGFYSWLQDMPLERT